jgi:multisubunit Na+/H+ antiporter MnhB subunit
MSEIVPHALLLTLSVGLSYGVYGTEAGRRLRTRELGRALLFGLGTLLVLFFGTAFGADGFEGWVWWFVLAGLPIFVGAAWADTTSANQEAVNNYPLPEGD